MSIFDAPRRPRLIQSFASLSLVFAFHVSGACSDHASSDMDASETHDDGSTPGLDAGHDASDGGDTTPTARLIVVGPEGHIASLSVASPWTMHASTNLGAPNASTKCDGTLCLVVHPSPTNTVDVIDARTLAVQTTFTLEADADPRDVALIDAHTAIVTQHGRASVLVLDLASELVTSVDLTPVSDEDGLAEAERVTTCGRRAYVQIARVDHETGVESKLGAGLAVLDFDLPAANRLFDVDPAEDGVQAIALAGHAEFDMPTDCAGARLFVAEPKPLFSGGGIYEVVNLTTFVATEYPFASSAEVGGFAIVDDVLGWRITHTDFGPGASSHLELVGAGPFDTHNTFSGYYVDDLALDRAEDLLFFPDPCEVTPANQACQGGVHVYHAHSGARARALPIDVGFTPFELAIAR